MANQAFTHQGMSCGYERYRTASDPTTLSTLSTVVKNLTPLTC